MHYYVLDIITPSAAPLAIEDYKGNGCLALIRLTGSLKGNRPNQVVTLLGLVVRNRLTEFGDGQFGVNGIRRPLRRRRQKALGLNAERGMNRCRAAQEDRRKQKQ
ncbi:MAG: hypothetical protein WBE89_19600 [Methyloceanibacter sp.]